MAPQSINTNDGLEHSLKYITYGTGSASWFDRMIRGESMATNIGITLDGAEATTTHAGMQVETYDLTTGGDEKRDMILKAFRVIERVGMNDLAARDITMSAIYEHKAGSTVAFSLESPGKPLICTRNFLQDFPLLPRPLLNPAKEDAFRQMRIQACRANKDGIDSSSSKEYSRAYGPVKRESPANTPPQSPNKRLRDVERLEGSDEVFEPEESSQRDSNVDVFASLRASTASSRASTASRKQDMGKCLAKLGIDVSGEVDDGTANDLLIDRCRALLDELTSVKKASADKDQALADATKTVMEKDKALTDAQKAASDARDETAAAQTELAGSESARVREFQRAMAERTVYAAEGHCISG